jgi:hypothetical protein
MAWRTAAATVTAAALTMAAVRAQQPAGAPVVGTGVICDSRDQAAQVVRLLRQGHDVAPALARVNEEARAPRACGVAAIAFVPGETVATETFAGRLLRIVRVTVVAGYNENGWHDVGRTVQYAIVDGSGEGI